MLVLVVFVTLGWSNSVARQGQKSFTLCVCLRLWCDIVWPTTLHWNMKSSLSPSRVKSISKSFLKHTQRFLSTAKGRVSEIAIHFIDKVRHFLSFLPFIVWAVDRSLFLHSFQHWGSCWLSENTEWCRGERTALCCSRLSDCLGNVCRVQLRLHSCLKLHKGNPGEFQRLS